VYFAAGQAFVFRIAQNPFRIAEFAVLVFYTKKQPKPERFGCSFSSE